MSATINLALPYNAKNIELVNALMAKADLSKNVNSLTVVDAEEVTAPPAKKPAASRPSRAKQKSPEPEIEEEDEDLGDYGDDDLGEAEDEDTDEEPITEDDLRELSAKKIGKHKDAIIAHLSKYKDASGAPVKGWNKLPEKHYAAAHAFLTKLK